MLDRFIQYGYVLLSQVIDAKTALEIADRVRTMPPVEQSKRGSKRKDAEPKSMTSDGWIKIFGEGGGDYDPFRVQRSVAADLAADLSTHLRPYWKAFYPRSEAQDWHALKLLPGGKKQAPHRDYTLPPNFAHLDHVNVPAGLIVSLEAGTHLYIYGWNRLCVDPQEEKLITLDVGDAIIFRGDLIHAGGAYNTTNVRLHAYLDVPSFKRKPDDTSLTPTLFYDDDVNSRATTCPLHNCEFVAFRDTLGKHVRSEHKARFNNKDSLLNHPAIRKEEQIAELYSHVITWLTTKLPSDQLDKLSDVLTGEVLDKLNRVLIDQTATLHAASNAERYHYVMDQMKSVLPSDELVKLRDVLSSGVMILLYRVLTKHNAKPTSKATMENEVKQVESIAAVRLHPVEWPFQISPERELDKHSTADAIDLNWAVDPHGVRSENRVSSVSMKLQVMFCNTFTNVGALVES